MNTVQHPYIQGTRHKSGRLLVYPHPERGCVPETADACFISKSFVLRICSRSMASIGKLVKGNRNRATPKARESCKVCSPPVCSHQLLPFPQPTRQSTKREQINDLAGEHDRWSSASLTTSLRLLPWRKEGTESDQPLPGCRQARHHSFSPTHPPMLTHHVHPKVSECRLTPCIPAYAFPSCPLVFKGEEEKSTDSASGTPMIVADKICTTQS